MTGDPSRRLSARQWVQRSAWRTVYSRWPAAPLQSDGYTVLIAVPGDLPVFLELALAGFSQQDPNERVETLVVPDQMTPAFAACFERCAARFDWGPLRLVEIGSRGRALQWLSTGPVVNHFLQIYTAAAAARTTHLLLHDADLFLLDRSFLVTRYHHCVERGLACLGLERDNGTDWYDRHGLGPVLATWELMLDVRWLREFAPGQLHGHHDRLRGLVHEFDTLDYVQARTRPERRGLLEAPTGFVHFNWTIIVYRHFQQAQGRPFEDDRFLILLVRLLSDALHAEPEERDDLPSAQELAYGITDSTARVTYRSAGLREKYAEFRRRLELLMNGPLADKGIVERVERTIAPFDAAFGGAATRARRTAGWAG